jgi:lactate racemase
MSISPSPAVSPAQVMRTAVWYGDRCLDMDFPPEWEMDVRWPSTPPAMTDAQIAEALARPIGQPTLRELCRGAQRPLIIIDDVNRPTPVDLVLPRVLSSLRDGGVSSDAATILVATGTHGKPCMESVLKKIGPAAGAHCTIVVHDANDPMAYLGKTRSGTPVLANKALIASDFVIGIGGIYPNHSAGYGGGAKLGLGVLGFRSILHLHYAHANAGWGGVPGPNTFRIDLEEIAEMLGIKSMISMQVNAERKPIRVTCGDYRSYYAQEVSFARSIFTVAPPQDADIVISNAYPNDLSLTFALMKGAAPLYRCGPASSRVLLASCSEGLGAHGLFPVVDASRIHVMENYLRLARTMKPSAFLKKVATKLGGKLLSSRMTANHHRPVFRNPIWLYQPAGGERTVSQQVAGVRVTSSWPEILEVTKREQGGRVPLKVVVYPCAPLISIG